MVETWGPRLLLFLDPQSGMMTLGSKKSKVKDSFCTCAHPEPAADFQCSRTLLSKDRGRYRTLENTTCASQVPDRMC